jgi:hypothetical protein
MTLDEIKQWLVSRDYHQDKYGHFQKTVTLKDGSSKVYRYKIQHVSIRKEVQCNHAASQYSPASKSWVRLASGYISQLSINDKNQIVGMK